MIEIPTSGVEGDDLYPPNEEDQKKIVLLTDKMFKDAETYRAEAADRWMKFYKMYRSFVEKRAKGDWKSRVWMPIAFFVIETIAPKIVAQLPAFTPHAVGPEDVMGEEPLETLLNWAADKSGLYLELVKAMKSALIYGTGVLKTSYREETKYAILQEPLMQEQYVDLASGETDVDGNPITTRQSLGSQPVLDETGQPQMTTVRRPYLSYAGPCAECVDIKDFFPDPWADSIDTCRYVIHRVYRDKAHMEKMFRAGIYKRPPEDVWNAFTTEHSRMSREAEINMGPGTLPINEDVYTLLEIWTPDVVITVAGEHAGILLRMERNPFAHAQIPFVRIVDHLVPNEFWGVGEMEPLEGLQDTLNALWNSRLDNVKLKLNSMFMGVVDYLENPGEDLQVRPGGFIRTREGLPLHEVVQPLNMGEVTSSSYMETEEVERLTEKVSGVSQYTAGNDQGTGALNRTATGVALISEQGNTRFAHKVKIAELTGWVRLAEHFGSILQQFAEPQMTIRILNPEGEAIFRTITAESIGGRFDYDIEAESSAQTESIRREQTLSLFQALAADPYARPLKIRADLLKTFGRKNVSDYILTEQELQMIMQQQAQQQAAMEEENAVETA